MELKTIGVVGAGVMGVGVSHDLARKGLHVLLVDVSDALLDRARREIKQSVRAINLIAKGEGGDSAEVLANIECSTDLAILAGADFVVENVTERWDVKRELYGRMDRVCAPHVVFAANTSAIPITRIGSATARPAQVVGAHFMNPVPLKPMVEVIRGYHTSDDTLATMKRLLAALGKDCIVVEDSPGFVSNRVLMLTVNEAIFLVHERVSTAPDIDRLFKTCFGHKMGPLETADLIGLDTILLSLEVLHECFTDDKYRPCPLLRKMVDAGLYGKKSGQGFYPYR